MTSTFPVPVLPNIYKGYEYVIQPLATEVEAVLPSVFAIKDLARLREQSGWTLDALADRLKLSKKQILALETGQWTNLPSGSLLKAFVRSYCRAIHADATPVLALLPTDATDTSIRLQPDKGIDTPFRRSVSRPSQKNQTWLIWMGLVLLLVAGWVAYAWQQNIVSLANDLTVFPPEVAQPPAVVEPIAVASPAPVDVEPAKEVMPINPDVAVQKLELGPVVAVPTKPEVNKTEPLKVEPVKLEPNIALSTAPSVTAPIVATTAKADAASAPKSAEKPAEKLNDKVVEKAVTHAQLEARFVQDSWVEIRQADGSLILSGIRKAGDNVALEGKAPFAVVIGNAAGVKLNYKGQPVAVEGEAKSNVARLTLN